MMGTAQIGVRIMNMNIEMHWVPDDYGYGSWYETSDSIRERIADRFGFQRNRIEIEDDSIFHNGGVAEECDFTVNGVRYNVRFNFSDSEKSRVLVY